MRKLRTYARIVFGLNALYQVLVGGLALFAPALLASAAYHVPGDLISGPLCAVFRGFGALIITLALASGLLAKDPDGYPVLYPLMGISAALTVLAWVLALVAGQMTIDQAVIDLFVQALILVAVLGYGMRTRVSAT